MAQHATPKMNAITYGKSWAEDIQKYHAAKVTLPWAPEQQTPVKYVTRFEKSREEHEYDLVLGKFRDTERELARSRDEKHALESNLENSRAKQLRNVQRFHVVNHSPMFPDAHNLKDKPSHSHPYCKKMAPEYNIISNVPNNGSNEGTGVSAASPAPSRRPAREFNILTNEYHDNHDARTQQDASKRKEAAAAKYYKTRNFDPVRITFVDDEKERAFAHERERKQQVHGKDRVLLLPPREQFAEGRLYNILNQRVINVEKVAAASEKDRRALNKIQKSAFEARMHALGDETLAKETALCLNRYAHERNAQTYVHGYDPISNEAFDGRHAKPKMPTRTHAAFSAWQVLSSGSPVNAKINASSSQQRQHKPAAATNASTTSQATKPAQTITASASAGTQRQTPKTQRANILVVEHVQCAPQASVGVRTGGFSQ